MYLQIWVLAVYHRPELLESVPDKKKTQDQPRNIKAQMDMSGTLFPAFLSSKFDPVFYQSGLEIRKITGKAGLFPYRLQVVEDIPFLFLIFCR